MDRPNNDGHYDPGNFAWVTILASARNRGVNVNLTISGSTMCAMDASRLPGANPYGAICKRARYMPDHEAVFGAIVHSPRKRRSINRKAA